MIVLKKGSKTPLSKTLECTQTVSSLSVYSKQVAGSKKYLFLEIVGYWDLFQLRDYPTRHF